MLKKLFLMAFLALFLAPTDVFSTQAVAINPSALAEAINQAEDSNAHPYGIMIKYKHTTPRQACLNTIMHRYHDWLKAGSKGDFIESLSKTYAPIGASNDPTGLNKNWVKNVKFFYGKFERQYKQAD